MLLHAARTATYRHGVLCTVSRPARRPQNARSSLLAAIRDRSNVKLKKVTDDTRKRAAEKKRAEAPNNMMGALGWALLIVGCERCQSRHDTHVCLQLLLFLRGVKRLQPILMKVVTTVATLTMTTKHSSKGSIRFGPLHVHDFVVLSTVSMQLFLNFPVKFVDRKISRQVCG